MKFGVGSDRGRHFCARRGFPPKSAVHQNLMDYNQSIGYLYSLGHEVLAAKFGLQNIGTLLDELGHPERSYRTAVVAGTNGKGSVAAMIEAVTRAAGHRTALFTSPHLLRVEERIKVAGREISADNFAALATRVRDAAEALLGEGKLLSPPTFFEQVTAIALSYFRDCAVELAILEVGLGEGSMLPTSWTRQCRL